MKKLLHMLESIRSSPHLFLGGPPNIHSLHSFICGYSNAYNAHRDLDNEAESCDYLWQFMPRSFHQWVSYRMHGTSECSYYECISSRYNDSVEGFDAFYKYLDEFLAKDDTIPNLVATLTRVSDDLEDCFASKYLVHTYTNDPGCWVDTECLSESQTFCNFYSSLDEFIEEYKHIDTYKVKVVDKDEWSRIKCRTR